MKDRIWKPLYAIWTANNGWAKSVDGIIRAFLTWERAEKFRKSHRHKYSTVRVMIPYLDSYWNNPPKKMEDVQEITNYWQYHHPKEDK